MRTLAMSLPLRTCVFEYYDIQDVSFHGAVLIWPSNGSVGHGSRALAPSMLDLVVAKCRPGRATAMACLSHPLVTCLHCWIDAQFVFGGGPLVQLAVLCYQLPYQLAGSRAHALTPLGWLNSIQLGCSTSRNQLLVVLQVPLFSWW